MQVGLPFTFADVDAARPRLGDAIVRTVQVETAERWHGDAVMQALEAGGFDVTALDAPAGPLDDRPVGGLE